MNIFTGFLTFIASLVITLTPQQSYTEGLVGQPRSFLPGEVVTENDKTVSKLLFRGLFRYGREEITSNDLLYTAFSTNELKEIATDKIDDYTIRYTLPNKFSPFLTLLTVGVMPANPKNSQLIPVSSGPYQVVRIKREGPVVREVVMQRLDNEYRVGRLAFRYYESE